MGKPWRPGDKIIEGPWTRAEAYPVRRRSRRGLATAVPVLVLASAVGMVFGYTQANTRREGVDRSAIEWNEVQAVPRAVADPEDAEWERRAQEGTTSTASAPAVAVRASFGFCKWGGGTNCVVDGDTFYLNGEKVRIAGIDAPETHPPRCDYEARLGNEATEKLQALLNSGAVTMTSIDRDRDVYGRLLRNVAVNGADVGEAMVSAGVAREYGSGRRSWCSTQ